MKRIVDRIISLLMTFVISVSIFCIPVSASFSSAVSGYWDWIKYYVTMQLWKDMASTSDPSSAYSSYVSGLNYDYISNTGFYLPAVIDHITFGDAGGTIDYTLGASFTVNWYTPNSYTVYAYLSPLTAPVSGTYTTTSRWFSYSNMGFTNFSLPSGNKASGATLISSNTSNAVSLAYVDKTKSCSFSGSVGWWVTPATWDTVNGTYSNVSRPTSLAAPLGYYDSSNNLVTDTTNTPIFNETTNNYYNPVTQQTVPVTGWKYDYTNREYDLTTANGTYKVIYGDQYITINEAGTTYNIYYVTQSEENDTPTYSGDDAGWTWWSQAWSDFTGWFKGLSFVNVDTSDIDTSSGSGSSSSEESPAFFSIDDSTGDVSIDDSYDFESASEDSGGLLDTAKSAAKGIWALVVGTASIFKGALFGIGSAVHGLVSLGKTSNPGGAFQFFNQVSSSGGN